MSAWAVTQRFDRSSFAIVNLGTGERLDFLPEDGPMIASILDSEFPECDRCREERSRCFDCGECEMCGDCGCDDIGVADGDDTP